MIKKLSTTFGITWDYWHLKIRSEMNCSVNFLWLVNFCVVSCPSEDNFRKTLLRKSCLISENVLYF